MNIIKDNKLYTFYCRKSKIIKPKYLIWDKMKQAYIYQSNNFKYSLLAWNQIMNCDL